MTNVNTIIMGGEAGETIAQYDILELNSDGELVKCDAAQAENAVGVALTGGAEGDQVSYVVAGKCKLYAFVEDTDASGTYSFAIARGDLLEISGKTSGTRTPGQAVSKILAASDGKVKVGRALEAVAGSDSADTYTLIDATVNFL